MKKRVENYTVILLIVVIGALFQHKYINEFPSHIHAWAQSDRYALALGFINNHFDFFHPQTFVKNHQFPDDWKNPSNTSITAVDFPIHDYLVALLMKCSGNHSPIVFRLYILLYGFIGLFFLFKLTRCITSDFYKSVFVVVFSTTSPIFIYYQSGFLPSIPSLSNTIIGLFLYFSYLKSGSRKHFIWAIFFLTLSTLSRTTFAIPLVAVFGTELLRILRRKIAIKHIVLPIVFSFGSILGYYFYNQFLTQKYGSIFLSSLMPPSDINSAISIVKAAIESWGTQYFSTLHYLVFVLLALTLFIIWALKPNALIKSKNWNEQIFLGLLILGNLLFSVVMLPQFRYHDYYFLDTYFLPIVFLLIFMLKKLPLLNKTIPIIGALSITVSLGLFWLFNGINTQKIRRETYPNDRVVDAIANFSGANRFLDSIGIAKDANIIVLTSPAPNLPFILMNRHGFVLMKPTNERIKNIISWPGEFIVFQNEYFGTDIYANYPEVIMEIEKIADNGRISICKKSISKTNNLSNFLRLNDKFLLMRKTLTFDEVLPDDWRNSNISTLQSFSLPNSSLLDSVKEYGLTYSTNTAEWLNTNGALCFINVKIWPEVRHQIEFVVSLSLNNETIYYKPININRLLKSAKAWETIELSYFLPKTTSPNAQLNMYFYNIGKGRIFIDDFNLQVFQQ